MDGGEGEEGEICIIITYASHALICTSICSENVNLHYSKTKMTNL